MTIAPIASGSLLRRDFGDGPSTATSGTCRLPVHSVRGRPLAVCARRARATGVGPVGVRGRVVVVVAGAGTLAARTGSLRSDGSGSPHTSRTAFASSSIVWKRCVAILGERAIDHVGERARRADPIERLRRDQRRRLGEVHRQHAHEVVGGERHAAGDELEQDAAHRVDVDAVIDVLAARLLGRHVLGRAEQHAGLGQLAAARRPSTRQLRDAEVEQLHEVGIAEELDEEHVLRLEIAVDDALGVRRRRARARSAGRSSSMRDHGSSSPANRARAIVVVQVVAGEQLHREEHASRPASSRSR